MLDLLSLNRGCNIELELTGASRIKLRKLDGDPGEAGQNCQTRYQIEVAGAQDLGLKSLDDASINELADKLLLAFNLNLRRSVLTRLKGDISRPDVEAEPPHSVTITRKQRPDGSYELHIEVTSIITVRSSFFICVNVNEAVDEDAVLRVLRMINELFESPSNDLRASNLIKALREYENAMYALKESSVFEHLFLALLHAVNYDEERTGVAFDEKASAVAKISKNDVTEWRELYNRMKHSDRTLKEVSRYVSGMEKLPTFIEPLRQVANTAIINRLRAFSALRKIQ